MEMQPGLSNPLRVINEYSLDANFPAQWYDEHRMGQMTVGSANIEMFSVIQSLLRFVGY